MNPQPNTPAPVIFLPKVANVQPSPVTTWNPENVTVPPPNGWRLPVSLDELNAWRGECIIEICGYWNTGLADPVTDYGDDITFAIPASADPLGLRNKAEPLAPVTLEPLSIKSAKQFVAEHHRHNKPPQGALFAVGAKLEDTLVGVAIVGRPIARMLADGKTCEVTRLCTDGTKNCCSLLYGAAARAAKALGYRRIITYILASEPGTSLRAAGWIKVADVKAEESWTRPNRPRINDKRPAGPKTRWVRNLSS